LILYLIFVLVKTFLQPIYLHYVIFNISRKQFTADGCKWTSYRLFSYDVIIVI